MVDLPEPDSPVKISCLDSFAPGVAIALKKKLTYDTVCLLSMCQALMKGRCHLQAMARVFVYLLQCRLLRGWMKGDC